MTCNPINHLELIIRKFQNIPLSYKFLDHATDAIIEVTAKNLKEAFSVTADAVINVVLVQNNVKEIKEIEFSAQGKDLYYLLFNWIEEITFVLITRGFAIKRIEFDMQENDSFTINAKAFGEPLDFQKHAYKMEIKAPTFHDMVIKQNGGILMRFLLDL